MHHPAKIAALSLACVAACALRAADAPPATPAAPAPAAPKAETYTVNISPPIKAGQKFTLAGDMSASQRMKISISGPSLPAPQVQEQNQAITAHLDGEAEALEVFPNGSLKKISLTVAHLTANRDGTPIDGLPKEGAKIIITKDDSDRETITVDDQPAASAAMRVLSSVAEMGRVKYLDQDAFGPKEPVAEGATWPVNSNVIKESSPQLGDAAAINGTMKLDKVAGTGDDRVFTVSGNFSASGLKLQLPAMLQVKSADMKAGLNVVVPTVTTKGAYSQTSTMNMTADAGGGSPDGSMEVKATIQRDEKRVTSLTFH